MTFETRKLFSTSSHCLSSCLWLFSLNIDTSRVVQAQVELEASFDAVAHAALVSIRDGFLGDAAEGQLEQFYAEPN